MKDLKLDEIIFERTFYERTKKEKKKLVKQLADQVFQHTNENTAWESERNKLVENEERRERAIV